VRPTGLSENSPQSSRPSLPLWARWVISLSVSAALLVALVEFVDHHNTDSLATENPRAAIRANREAEIIVAQDQAPHVVKLRSGTLPRAALRRTVAAEMARRIAAGQVSGPVQHTTCARTGGRAVTPAFRCTVDAAGVNYEFLGVVDVGARRVTYCKRDVPPVPSQSIAVSRRCLA
jgi:hypothetical protein